MKTGSLFLNSDTSILCDSSFDFVLFFFSSRRRHTRSKRDWSSDVCSSDLLFGVTSRAVIQDFSSMEEIAVIPLSDLAAWIDERGRYNFPNPEANARKLQQRSEERRVGKSVDLGGRSIIKKKSRKEKKKI